MKTYSELLASLKETQLLSSEFVELNKHLMVQSGSLSERDYDYFWGCMSIFAEHKENHFDDYLRLRANIYGDFSHGIDAWFRNEIRFFGGSPAEVFLQIVDALQFFEVKEYHGIPFSEFENTRCHINLHTQIAKNEVQQSYQEKAVNGINKKIEDYFGFDSYSEERFIELFNRIIKQQKSKSYLIDEAISISKSAPDATYIVLFKNGEEVCAVTKTAHLLSHIEKGHKQYNANSVAFDFVDGEYADDLLIALLEYFSLLPPKIHLTVRNRKYTDLNSAVFVYQRSNSISKKQVLFAIENTPIYTIETVSGQIVLDKVKLHKALFCHE